MRLIDSCITQLTAQGPSRTCNESQEEEGKPNAQTAGRRHPEKGDDGTRLDDGCTGNDAWLEHRSNPNLETIRKRRE